MVLTNSTCKQFCEIHPDPQKTIPVGHWNYAEVAVLWSSCTINSTGVLVWVHQCTSMINKEHLVISSSDFIKWHHMMLIFYTCIKSYIAQHLWKHLSEVSITQCCPMKSLELRVLLNCDEAVQLCVWYQCNQILCHIVQRIYIW